jgi:serine protease inhibitor
MFPLLPSFKETVENNYYAAVDNMDFSDPDQVASRLNEWARRSTDGFIGEILKSEDISKDAVAFIMNALYFKAKWADDIKPMFDERYTICPTATFVSNTKCYNNMFGHKGQNRKYFENEYTRLNIRYAKDTDMGLSLSDDEYLVLDLK